MENFRLVSTQVWILFALIGLGAACRWMKWVDDAAIKGIVNVLILLVTPSLIIDVFQRPFEAHMLAQLGTSFAIAFAAHIGVILAATLIVRGGGAMRRPVLRLAVVFSNAGFMGIPLEHAILGDAGVFFGITYVVAFNLFIWSWGIREFAACSDECADSVSARKEDAPPQLQTANRKLQTKQKLRTMFINPGTIGLAAGLGLFLARITLPQVIAQPVKFMASMNTPLAMIVIGYYLAGAKLRAIARLPAAYAAAFARLVIYPLVVLAALYPFRGCLNRDMMLALVIAASAPVAAMVTMFSSKFSRDVDLSVGLVSATTLLSMLTMPVIIALAMSVL